MEKTTILIVDDHILVRESWSLILNKDPRFRVIGEAGTAEEAIIAAKHMRPNIVIMDINLPGLDGVEATQQIRKLSPGSKILAVSAHTQPVYARQMIKSGASGYLTKNSPHAEMIKALLHVQKGETYICDQIKNTLSEQVINEGEEYNGLDALTQREIEIIAFIKNGNTSREIANVLHIAIKTVEVHRHNILKKLKLRNTSSLISFIYKKQLEFKV
jgi:two-component system invasion response regulator UvrY